MQRLNLPENLKNLPFDQYSRQFWAAQLIESIRPKGQRLKIVDVGGYKGQTREFQSKDEVIVCDLFDVEEEGYVKGDGTKLPFDDDEFDIAVTFDALEHVPTAKRKKFISELLRVSSRAVIIAAPFDDKTHATINAEKRMNTYYKDLYNKDHRWLQEHIDLKTPQMPILDRQLEESGYHFAKLPTNNRLIWELLQSVYFSIELDHELRERTHELNWLYNTNLLKIDPSYEGESYRMVYFISSNKASVKAAKELMASIPEPDKLYAEEFVTKIMHIFGLMYRDVVNHGDHLQSMVTFIEGKRLKSKAMKARDTILTKRKAK